ncbi:MAG: Wzz/FepE/Etk N-terminal domain-containing protein [Phycisphaerae bacterium]|nr:Wzz/FepE/Etk N-terminal domain-containing protein [Phycisphaerae bacterium]
MTDNFAAKTLRELSRVLFTRFWMMLLIVAAATAGTYGLCTIATPQYRSAITLIFKQPVGQSPVFQESPERTLEVFVKAQQQIVMSDLVLARTKVIAEDPKLRARWYELRERLDELQTPPADPAEPYDAKRNVELNAAHAAMEEFLTQTSPNGRDRTVADRVADLMRTKQRDLMDFRDDVQLKTPGGEQVAMTESFQILVDRPAPVAERDSHLLAMHAAEVLADMYMVRFREFQQAMSGAAGVFMKRVVEQHAKVVERAQKKLDDFVATELDSPGDVAILEQLLKSGTEHGYQIIATRAREADLLLRDQLTKAKSLSELLRKFLPAEAFEPNGPESISGEALAKAVAVVPPEVLESNIIINRLTEELMKVRSKQASLAPQFTEANRALRDVNQQLEETQRQLLREMLAHARSLDITIQSLQVRLSENETNLKNIEGRLDKINRKLTEYQGLKNDVAVAQKQHQDLQQEQVNAFSADERARAAVTIRKLDHASRPAIDKPSQPLTMAYTIIAAVSGLFLAFAYAFLSDHFDQTFRTIDEAERFLGIPVVGSVSKKGRTILTSA